MLDLNDPKWKTFIGGYGTVYDASVPLSALQNSTSAEEIDDIFIELWDELHHQGDVNTASYYAVPHLVRIGIEKNIIDYNIFGLVTIIAVQRSAKHTMLPKDLEESYLKSLKDLGILASKAIAADWDLSLATDVLASLAVSKGQIKLANAIINLNSEDVIDEFLNNY